MEIFRGAKGDFDAVANGAAAQKIANQMEARKPAQKTGDRRNTLGVPDVELRKSAIAAPDHAIAGRSGNSQDSSIFIFDGEGRFVAGHCGKGDVLVSPGKAGE